MKVNSFISKDELLLSCRIKLCACIRALKIKFYAIDFAVK